MSCRRPGLKLGPLIEPWPAGQPIHVVYDSAFEPGSFNPGVNSHGRLRQAIVALALRVGIEVS